MLLFTGCSQTPREVGVWRSRSLDGPSHIDVPNGSDGDRTEMDNLRMFEQAGPVMPMLDFNEIMQARQYTGEYRVVSGDVIEFDMPAILQAVTPGLADAVGKFQPYKCRVSMSGTIYMPIVGELLVAGKTLAQIEEMIVKTFYPKYVLSPPSVVGTVVDHKTARITIVGAVEKEGIYHCNSNEMTVVDLIMKAGGIVSKGAARIRIRRANDPGGSDPVVLPVKGLNIPFVNVSLRDGDTVEVEPLNPQVFTVIGLVSRSGVFDYPEGARYNLLQALAFAGGVNELAAPEYARVYRQTADGKIISASFRLKGTLPADAANLMIKPGDVIAVEQTFSTRTRLLFAQILRVTAGFNAYSRFPDDD